jgi:hypothetical protein
VPRATYVFCVFSLPLLKNWSLTIPRPSASSRLIIGRRVSDVDDADKWRRKPASDPASSRFEERDVWSPVECFAFLHEDYAMVREASRPTDRRHDVAEGDEAVLDNRAFRDFVVDEREAQIMSMFNVHVQLHHPLQPVALKRRIAVVAMARGGGKVGRAQQGHEAAVDLNCGVGRRGGSHRICRAMTQQFVALRLVRI